MICYMIGSFASMTLLMKNSLIENLSADYVLTAHAKGLGNRTVVFKHALRNSLIPLAAGFGNNIGLVLTGSFLIEQIFNIDGLGLLGFEAVTQRDYPVVMGNLFVASLLFLVGNILWTFAWQRWTRVSVSSEILLRRASAPPFLFPSLPSSRFLSVLMNAERRTPSRFSVEFGRSVHAAAFSRRFSVGGLRGSSPQLWDGVFRLANRRSGDRRRRFLRRTRSLDLRFVALLPPESVASFPGWDNSPYDIFSPDKEIVAERIRCLLGILNGEIKVVVATLKAALQRILPPEALKSKCFSLEIGKEYPRADLRRRLSAAGYVAVEQVESVGEFAVRGQIVDVFSSQHSDPLRLDFSTTSWNRSNSFRWKPKRPKKNSNPAPSLPSSKCSSTKPA